MQQLLHDAIVRHGYWLIATLVGIESMGVPVPGESALILAAAYAGTTHDLNIMLIIVAAILGAVTGDNIGYMLGRHFGCRLLQRYAHLAHIDARRIAAWQEVFAHHGGKIVFFGRFVAVLRVLAAALAGLNQMSWRRFLVFNAGGAIVWAAACGWTAYALGTKIESVMQRIGIAGLIVIAIVVVMIWRMQTREGSKGAGGGDERDARANEDATFLRVCQQIARQASGRRRS